jgi:hypothetical protein
MPTEVRGKKELASRSTAGSNLTLIDNRFNEYLATAFASSKPLSSFLRAEQPLAALHINNVLRRLQASVAPYEYSTGAYELVTLPYEPLISESSGGGTYEKAHQAILELMRQALMSAQEPTDELLPGTEVEVIADFRPAPAAVLKGRVVSVTRRDPELALSDADWEALGLDDD